MRVINTNITGTLYLIQKIGRDMRERRTGRILITGSIAGFLPGTYQAVYNGTKAFLDSFSFALRHEIKDSGVTVTCLCPGPTRTGFMARAKMGNPETLSKKSVMMEAEAVARRGFDGLMKGKRLVIPGILNKILAHSTRLGSRGLSASVVRRLMEEIRSTGEPPAK